MNKADTCLVTGVSGFIGSHLAEKLTDSGYRVIGLDCFTNYYNKNIKLNNLTKLLTRRNFHLIEADLLDIDLESIVNGSYFNSTRDLDWSPVSYILHLAAQAGVRSSWGSSFDTYTSNNILATQKLLEASKGSSIKMFVNASSSSVYGNADILPTSEDTKLHPISPYGVSKLAGEHLCQLYWENYQLPVLSLRYFTVYGPRQRPDMGFHKFIKAIQEGNEITLFGDGEQTRDCTYVGDVVDATISAMTSSAKGQVFNIGADSPISVNKIILEIETILNIKSKIRRIHSQKGDVNNTWANINLSKKVLNYFPKISIRAGLEAQVKYILENEVS